MFTPVAFAEFVPATMLATPTWDIAPGSSNFNAGINLTALTGVPQSCKAQFRTQQNGGGYSAFADVSLPQNMVAPGVYIAGTTEDVQLRLIGLHSGQVSASSTYSWVHP